MYKFFVVSLAGVLVAIYGCWLVGWTAVGLLEQFPQLGTTLFFGVCDLQQNLVFVGYLLGRSLLWVIGGIIVAIIYRFHMGEVTTYM